MGVVEFSKELKIKPNSPRLATIDYVVIQRFKKLFVILK